MSAPQLGVLCALGLASLASASAIVNNNNNNNLLWAQNMLPSSWAQLLQGWQQAQPQPPRGVVPQLPPMAFAQVQVALPNPQFDRALEAEPAYVSGYEVVERFPHDADAFTQGLFVHDGVLFESTGLYGKSTVRKVDVKTGKVLQMSKFNDRIFGEGIAMHKGKIYALTWRERTAYRIDPDTLKVEEQFPLPQEMKEGWGITSDGNDLIITDSTSKLFRTDERFRIKDSKTMYDPTQKVELPFVNELEFIDGKLYGNVYGLDHIAVLSAESGRVEKWIDCRGLWPGGRRGSNTVFNGIAFDPVGKHLYVTGKNWPALYEIKLK